MNNKQISYAVSLASAVMLFVCFIAGFRVAFIVLTKPIGLDDFVRLSSTDQLMFTFGVIGICIGAVIMASCIIKGFMVFCKWVIT